MKITPAHFEAVGSLLRQRAVRPTVGCVVLGGEQLRAAHLDPWRGLLDSTPIFNEYGPTEATVGCSAHRLDPAVSNPDRDGDAVPIGRPITGASAHVLDDALAVPIGVVSELYVGGVGLARGYLGQPGPTADRFVPDPYGSGARLYRTGDLARLGDDGHLRFVGRRDRQLKVRGHRIEPDEIELELRRHPAVRDAAVTALPEAAGHRRLAAYWVPSAGASPRPDAAELADWLARRVPGHLVPDVLIELPMLPLTSRGKVDYARLPEPGLSRRDILLALVESTTDDTAQSWLAEATPRKERR
jgi:acyl-coenzyme A synthetase/AMP-(fatty) acid ligase